MQAPEVNPQKLWVNESISPTSNGKIKTFHSRPKLLFLLGVSSCDTAFSFKGGYLTNIQIQMTYPSNLPHQLFFCFFSQKAKPKTAAAVLHHPWFAPIFKHLRR